MRKNEEEIREYIKQIREICDKMMDGMDDFDADEEEDDGFGQTDVLSELHQNAMESLELRNSTTPIDPDKAPYLVRRRNGKKIPITANIFKIGKEESYVDYCISDNPTISRSHADIIKKSDGFYVKDKGSLNHTFLNGKKLEQDVPKKLEKGCLVQLSNEVFEWHCE
jgi:pSer/pThr/pTyr-binding forkhead associated (FHA) protein